MTNEQMKPFRFLRWQMARSKIAFIQSHLLQGQTVYLCTMTRATKLTAKNFDMIKATKSGAYMQSGKNWVCIDGCGVKVGNA